MYLTIDTLLLLLCFLSCCFRVTAVVFVGVCVVVVVVVVVVAKTALFC